MTTNSIFKDVKIRAVEKNWILHCRINSSVRKTKDAIIKSATNSPPTLVAMYFRKTVHKEGKPGLT